MPYSPETKTQDGQNIPAYAEDLTTQEIIYAFIERYIEQHGFSPSIRDIARACQVGPTTVFYHLNHMEMQGWITRLPHKARSLRLAARLKKIEQN